MRNELQLPSQQQKTPDHFECAADAGNSEQKRARLIDLPRLVFEQAATIAEGCYTPQPFTVFAVTDPKLREIFAPDFSDRLVQQWLVRHIEPWWDKRFIDDSYANRQGRGTQAAITRLQGFMRQPGRRWYCKLDIRAFFAVLLADDPATLVRWQHAIDDFLRTRLRLEPHPDKIVLQRSNQGIDFLGSIVFPKHCLTRQRGVRALRRRIAWFNELIFSGNHPPRAPQAGNWQRWLKNNTPFIAPGIPSPALLQRMLATLNSYYGQFIHADTYRLRRHFYQKELEPLKRFFLPDGPGYRHLRIRKAWLPVR